MATFLGSPNINGNFLNWIMTSQHKHIIKFFLEQYMLRQYNCELFNKHCQNNREYFLKHIIESHKFWNFMI